MLCPWLVKVVTQTDNKNSYNQSQRTEHREYEKCAKQDCPFYREKNETNKCLRVKAMIVDCIPLEPE